MITFVDIFDISQLGKEPADCKYKVIVGELHAELSQGLPSGVISLMSPKTKLFHFYVLLAKLVIFAHSGQLLTCSYAV